MDDLLVFVLYVMALMALLGLAALCTVGWLLGLLGLAIYRLIQYGGKRLREHRAYPVARREINGMFDAIEHEVDRHRLAR